MTVDLAFLTIAEASALIQARHLSPVEYVEALITRAETLDPQLHAYITPTFDLARQQAKQAEHEIMAGTYRGPMHGIPFALKDIYDTQGIRTSGHSQVCRNRIPDADATTTGKLYESGAILMGKLATHEFAHGGPSFDLPWPPARNPWHLAHFTGGSSSGSGAAVAAGLVPMALGSDTGGSIRGPASLCGVAGLMPTFGLVGRGGVLPNSYTFDHCGPLARSVEDCAIVLQVIAGFDPRDAGSLQRPIPEYRAALRQDLKGLRIGVLRHHWEADLPASEDVRRAMEEALHVLKSLGAELEDCRVRLLQRYFDIKVIIAETEIFSIHQPDLIARPGDFGADFRARVLPAVLFTANDYVQATREHRRMVAEMAPLYQQYDAFITAGQGEAPRLDAHRSLTFWQRPNLFTAANVTSQPALEICNGFGAHGLPLGMQILGRPFDDATVLRVGHAYEQATDWHRRHPPLRAGAEAPVLTPPPVLAGTADQTDAAMREACAYVARRAGFTLDDEQFAQLLEGAPYALGMVQRLRRDHGYTHEPANVFRFPASVLTPLNGA
jgi:aspartyl-tRNA(Asn)/glutamyl-tRNA(Gln) amidotransferase subunit A